MRYISQLMHKEFLHLFDSYYFSSHYHFKRVMVIEEPHLPVEV